MQGACRCGAVTYDVKGVTKPVVYVCHCLDCQTWSGSAFSEHAMIPDRMVALSGVTTGYSHEGDGFVSRQTLCATCFTRLYNTNDAVPGMVILRAGTLTDSDRLVPVAHIWTSRKQSWVVIPDGVPQWPGTPTAEQFGQALAKAAR